MDICLGILFGMKKNLIKVTVRFKKTKKACKATVLRMYGACLVTATEEAKQYLDFEYFGNAVLLSGTEGWRG